MNRFSDDNVEVLIKLLPSFIAMILSGLALVKSTYGADINDLMPYLFSAVLALTANEIGQKFFEKFQKSKMKRYEDNQKSISNYINRNNVVVIDSEKLNEPRFYRELWGGFDRDVYYAFNPAYGIETKQDKKKLSQVVSIFEDRYNSISYAEYIFIVKEETDPKKDSTCEINFNGGKKEIKKSEIDLHVFRALMERVSETFPDIKKKGRLRVRKSKDDPDKYGEFYLGKKSIASISDEEYLKCCIFEPSKTSDVSERGNPNYYLLTNNEELWNFYLSRFKNWKHKSEEIDFWGLPVYPSLLD